MNEQLPGRPGPDLWWLMLAAGVSLAACGLVPHYQRPALDLPPATHAAEQAQERAHYAAMQGWWRQFQDPLLNRLVDEALANNLDIALQAARIQEARAQLELAGAQFHPEFNADFTASRSRNGATGLVNPGSQNSTARASGQVHTQAVSASLSYELNLFSALAGRQAADAWLRSSLAAQQAIRLAVVGDVVSTYVSLRDVMQRLQLTVATIDTRQEDLRLAEIQYRHGAIGRLELLQRRAVLASLNDQLPSLRQQAAQLEVALALLSGHSARQIMASDAMPAGQWMALKLPDQLPTLLPAALLERRPDIRVAEEGLVAAHANVSVARAEYFPRLDLSALVGSRASDFGGLLGAGTRQSSLAAGWGGPFLSLGRIQAGVATAEARREQALLVYRQTVQQAFGEVRTALIDVQASAARVRSTEDEMHVHEESLQLARQRHQAGRIGLQDVLESQRQLYAAQLESSAARRDRLLAAAALFKALGGGWLNEDGRAATAAPQETREGMRVDVQG